MSQDQKGSGADVYATGLATRRHMFGVEGADKQIEAASDFTLPLQDMVTRYCFGEVWNRPALDLKTRSLLTLALLTALGKQNQLRVHVRDIYPLAYAAVAHRDVENGHGRGKVVLMVYNTFGHVL